MMLHIKYQMHLTKYYNSNSSELFLKIMYINHFETDF